MSAHYEFVTRSGLGTVRVLVDWPAHRDTMVAMRATGSTKLELAEHYGVTFSAIERVISTLKLPSVTGGRGLPLTPAWEARKQKLADIKAARKPEVSRNVPAQRVCISRLSAQCKGVFASTGAGNRVCGRCRSIPAGGMD